MDRAQAGDRHTWPHGAPRAGHRAAMPPHRRRRSCRQFAAPQPGTRGAQCHRATQQRAAGRPSTATLSRVPRALPRACRDIADPCLSILDGKHSNSSTACLSRRVATLLARSAAAQFCLPPRVRLREQVLQTTAHASPASHAVRWKAARRRDRAWCQPSSLPGAASTRSTRPSRRSASFIAAASIE